MKNIFKQAVYWFNTTPLEKAVDKFCAECPEFGADLQRAAGMLLENHRAANKLLGRRVFPVRRHDIYTEIFDVVDMKDLYDRLHKLPKKSAEHLCDYIDHIHREGMWSEAQIRVLACRRKISQRFYLNTQAMHLPQASVA